MEHMKDIPHARAFNNIANEASRLPTKYDWFTGKPISGYEYTYTNKKDDWVLDELAYISATVTRKPSKIIEGVELTNEQYSKFCELHGTVKLRGGKNLYEAVKQLMESPRYDFEEKYHNHALIGENRSYKGDLVNEVIDDYRQAAKKALLKTYPELANDIRKAKREQRRTRQGRGVGRQSGRNPLRAFQN
jgi:hypothetical protein